jgi:aminoglycoside 3-N-acetyltransferase
MPPDETWSVDRLAGQLRAAGIASADKVFVHMGLRPTGLARSEIPNLVEAFLQTVGPAGAVYYPAHTYSYRGWLTSRPFSPDTPCSPSIGMWPELLRKRPDALRSHHPTHSTGGIGAGVDRILAGHANTEAVGVGSPLDLLRRQNATVMLVGCGFESCTILHLAETLAQVPYLGQCPDADSLMGLTHTVTGVIETRFHERPGCSKGFPKMEPLLRAAGAVAYHALGMAPARVCRMQPLVDAAVAAFRENPFGYLCDCEHCCYVRGVCGSP